MKRMTTQQAADHVGVSYWTLVNWRKLEKGPTFRKICGKVRYDIEDLNSFLEASKKYARN